MVHWGPSKSPPTDQNHKLQGKSRNLKLLFSSFNLLQTEHCCDKLYITWDVCAYGFWGYYTYYRGSPSTPVLYETISWNIWTFEIIYLHRKVKHIVGRSSDNLGGSQRKARSESEVCVRLQLSGYSYSYSYSYLIIVISSLDGASPGPPYRTEKWKIIWQIHDKFIFFCNLFIA